MWTVLPFALSNHRDCSVLCMRFSSFSPPNPLSLPMSRFCIHLLLTSPLFLFRARWLVSPSNGLSISSDQLNNQRALSPTLSCTSNDLLPQSLAPDSSGPTAHVVSNNSVLDCSGKHPSSTAQVLAFVGHLPMLQMV